MADGIQNLQYLHAIISLLRFKTIHYMNLSRYSHIITAILPRLALAVIWIYYKIFVSHHFVNQFLQIVYLLECRVHPKCRHIAVSDNSNTSNCLCSLHSLYSSACHNFHDVIRNMFPNDDNIRRASYSKCTLICAYYATNWLVPGSQ